MAGDRIFFLIPDLSPPPFRAKDYARALLKGEREAYLKRIHKNPARAIGGLKIMYQHCHALRQAGLDASMLALGAHDGNYFRFPFSPVPVETIGFNLGAGDIVVATEVSPYDALKFVGGRKLLFAQSWINLKRRLTPDDQGRSYRDLGYDGVIACSDYIARSIDMLNNEACDVLYNGIDPAVFHPDPAVREANRILCLTRRNPGDIAKIRAMVHAKIPTANFVAVDGLTETELAAEYRRADIFLAVGYPEGLPLPPLEAIFSGCVVVGFAGRGGRQYLIDGETALIAEDGDCVTAASHLVRALRDPGLKEQIRNGVGAIRTTYTYEAMAQNVVAYYRKLLADDRARSAA